MSRRLPQLTQLRAARLSRGLRLEDVAREACVSRTRASYIERGLCDASDGEIAELIAAIDRLAASDAPVGSRTAQRLAIDILDRLAGVLSDVLATGAVSIEELSALTGIEVAAVRDTIERAETERARGTR